jgi:hypothetical protein
MRTKPTKPQNQAANGTMTKTEATKRGLRPLAGPYGKGEYWMVESLCSDLLRGGIVHAVIKTSKSFEVWRTASGWLENRKI